MEKEELTDAVRDGIYEGIFKIYFTIAIVVLIVCIVLGILFLIIGGSFQGEIQEPIKCEFELINCYVVDESNSGGGALLIIKEKDNLCGYNEANAWFEQYKNKINKENLYIDCF